MQWVYPRVGGGTLEGLVGTITRSGLSPRGRGNLLHGGHVPSCVGSIPAWAGEPVSSGKQGLDGRVYPRVGGGTLAPLDVLLHRDGLSPRGRGNRGTQTTVVNPQRSIPAWAGEPYRTFPHHQPQTIYPRVGGGTAGAGADSPPPGGLSPRGRGNPLQEPRCRDRIGSIPAWAGEPEGLQPSHAQTRVYPRVGGGTAAMETTTEPWSGLSPRGRGNRSRGSPTKDPRRSIPAWAGEPGHWPAGQPMWTVYPRVGGGTLRPRSQ